jgi:hypothetical protein
MYLERNIAEPDPDLLTFGATNDGRIIAQQSG